MASLARGAFSAGFLLASFSSRLTFKLKAAQGAEGEGDAGHVVGLGDVGEAGRGQLVGQPFRHARVAQRAVHQHKGKHFQQAVLDLFLQLGDLAAQVVQHSGQGRAEDKRQRAVGGRLAEAYDPRLDTAVAVRFGSMTFSG